MPIAASVNADRLLFPWAVFGESLIFIVDIANWLKLACAPAFGRVVLNRRGTQDVPAIIAVAKDTMPDRRTECAMNDAIEYVIEHVMVRNGHAIEQVIGYIIWRTVASGPACW